MPEPPRDGLRDVRSSDPSLSAEANDRLTRELREIIGSDRVSVPADPAHERHGTHAPWTADAIGSRLGWILIALAGIAVAAIVALAWNTTASLLVALAVLVVTTIAALAVALNATSEVEHPDPQTAALLEEEGVGDPDRLLEDLVEEFRPPQSPR
jgi:hypothetical protein